MHADARRSSIVVERMKRINTRKNVTARNADGVFLTLNGEVLTMAGREGVIHFYNGPSSRKGRETATAIKQELEKVYPGQIEAFECWDIRNHDERA